MNTLHLHLDELLPGDRFVRDGCERRITDVIHRAGMAWPVAVDGTGWAIALDHRTTVRVLRPERRATPSMVGSRS